LSEILQNTIKRDGLINEVKLQEKELEASKSKLNTIKEEIKVIENDKNKKQFELNEIKAELDGYVQKRLSLVNEAKRLEQKEIYIKSKFSEAGLSYN